MADFSKIKIGSNTYDVKDATARSTASEAKTTAESAETTANSALAQVEGIALTDTYDSTTEILTLSV